MTCAVIFLFLYQPLLLATLDLKLYDTLLKSRPVRTAADSIVIVDIDVKSLSQYGQWPWPRYRIAQLIDKLRKMGALSIGVDILFAEPDRSSLGNMQKTILSDFNYSVDLSGVPRHYIDNDALLAEAIKKGPIALGYQFSFGETVQRSCTLHPISVLVRKEEGVSDSANGLFKPSSVDCIYQPLADAAPASGFINVQTDYDGIIRRVPLMMEYNARFYPHLSLAVLLLAVKPEQMVLSVGKAGTDSLSIDSVEIPLEQNGAFLIPFQGPSGTYRHISASDILHGTAKTQEIEGHIVLIGSAAPGLMDIRATPTAPTMAGVEVHANIIDSILHGDFIMRPKAAIVYELIAVVFFGLLSTILFARCRALANLIFFILCMSSGLVLTISLFRNGIYVSPLYPGLAYATNFSILSLLNFWREERKLKKKTSQQLATQDAMIETIANITETRDPETGGHIRRTRSYVKALAEHIRNKPDFADCINEEFMEHLLMSAPLHDVGKVGVPDQILLKPSSLTADEFEVIKQHTQYGKRIIEAAQDKLGNTSFMKLAAEMAFSHHEHWDGKGYPDGLKGEEIPLSGRIMAVADVYDALISDRPYKSGLPHNEAVEVILAGRGTQFDPQLIDAFSEIHVTFQSIAKQFSDRDMHESFISGRSLRGFSGMFHRD